jgi:hypothetical protein
MAADPRYIVEIRHRNGNYLAELDLDRADRGTVLTDLLAGQYQAAARVYRLEDATADFARAICRHCLDEGEDVPLWLEDLVANAKPVNAKTLTATAVTTTAEPRANRIEAAAS